MQGELAGVPAAWRTYGTGPVQALALHCALGHSGAWAGLAAKLPGLTITALDLLGHGRSADWDGVSDYHATATAMAVDLAERTGTPLVLIGHSLGGTVALRMALERPGIAARLVLIEPVLFIAADPQALAAHMAQHAAFAASLAGDRARAAALFQEIWGNGQPFADAPESQRRYITERIHLIDAPAPALNEDRAGMLAPGRLEGLRAPVLLLRGDRSPEVVEAIGTQLSRRLPDAEQAVIAGAGHMLPITHPADCAARIAAFLDRQPRNA